MTKEEIKALRRIIKKDKKFIRFREAYEGNPAFNIDFEDFHEELKRLHETRSTRHLKRKSKGFTEDVIDGMLQDQATRSRVAEILGQCVKISSSVEKTLNNLRDYLLSEFSTQLKRLGAQTERKMFIESVMSSFYEYVSDVQTLEKSCRLIVDDIDKAGYTYRNLVEAIKILSRPEQVSL